MGLLLKSPKKVVEPRNFHSFVPVSIAPGDERLIVDEQIFRVRDRLVLPNTAECRRGHVAAQRAVRNAVRKLSRRTGVALTLSPDFLIWFHNLFSFGAYVIPEDYGNRVFLNWPMFLANKSIYFSDVIPHEVAHLFQHVLAPKEAPHGPCWQSLMRELGLAPDVLLDFKEEIRDYQTVYVYDCACQHHILSRRQHFAIGTRGILRGKGSNGYCTECGNDIRFLYESFSRNASRLTRHSYRA